jgi:hypothetical protein
MRGGGQETKSTERRRKERRRNEVHESEPGAPLKRSLEHAALVVITMTLSSKPVAHLEELQTTEVSGLNQAQSRKGTYGPLLVEDPYVRPAHGCLHVHRHRLPHASAPELALRRRRTDPDRACVEPRV